MDAHAVHKQRVMTKRTAYDAPSPAAAGVKERTGGGDDETAGFSFPAMTSRLHREAPSSSTSTTALPPRPGEEFEQHGKGVFNFHPERRGGFFFADHGAASSASVRSDDDDFYSRCARIYAPSLSTATPRNPCLTMEAWMASQSQSQPQSSRADDTEVALGLARAMDNVSAALAPQPHSGWNPMGYMDEMARRYSYRHVSPASVVSSYPPHAQARMGGGQDGRAKAELCVQWVLTGACRNGGGCRFAHGKEEPLRQTQACKDVRAGAGFLCPFGPQCPFPH